MTCAQLEGGQSIDSCAAHQVLQGIAHTSLPHYGVQFHPESIGTAYGRQLLQNFHNLTAKYRGMQLPKQPAAVSTGESARLSLDVIRSLCVTLC